MNKNASHQDLNLYWIIGVFLLISFGIWGFGGFGDLSLGDPWSWSMEIGRLSGMAGSALLLLQTFMMARVPFIENNLSKDTIVRVHRQSGFWSFWLIIVHILLITLGYAGSFSGLIDEFLTIVMTMDGVLWSLMGTLLIIFVVVISIRNVMKKFEYESWHLLHLYAYLGTFLALPHQLWTGRDFVNSGISTVFWWTIWGITAASVLYYRLLTPFVGNYLSNAKVFGIKALGQDLFEMTIHVENMERLKLIPAQFFNLRFITKKGFTKANPFSISKVYKNGFAIIFKVAGEGTQRMTQLDRGTRVFFEGPYGNLYRKIDDNADLVLIGAGTGVAPFISIMNSVSRSRKVYVIQRSSNKLDPLLKTVEDIAKMNSNIKHIKMIGNRSAKMSWATSEYDDSIGSLASLFPTVAPTRFYLCGPHPWVLSVTAYLKSIGVEQGSIHFESFGW